MKKILLTGGGTAGHVTPNIALLPGLKDSGYDISYIGSYDGIEKTLMEELKIPYCGISSGKLRRYFDPKNFTDPFRVLTGCKEAYQQIKKIKPDIVFSKGGFVTVPVVFAARLLKIPIIIHESDMTPGLANRLSLPFATKVCCNFPETVLHLPKDKAVLTGSPIRRELLTGNKNKAISFTGLQEKKPVLLVAGGSMGATNINNSVRSALPQLLKTYQVIHLCGKGKLDPALSQLKGYAQYEYIGNELKDLFALADIVISRAGANFICELLALRKPNLLIPLSAKASRGDQILNANSFEAQGFSTVLQEEEMADKTLIESIHKIYENRASYESAMASSKYKDAIPILLDLFETCRLK